MNRGKNMSEAALPNSAKSPASPAALAALALFAVLPLLLPACAKPRQEAKAAVPDLDSLHRHLEYQDSVESNVFFYEEAYERYRKRYPGVLKGDFMRMAKGKDQDFCLFKEDPAASCLACGDRFNDVELKDQAKECYEAGLLSEGANDQAQNVRIWGSLGQLSVEAKDYGPGKVYLGKLLEVEPKNKWAKKLLASIPKDE
jgi:hypothetical protein